MIEELKENILNYIKALTNGITCEQLIDIIINDYNVRYLTRKEIREIIESLINNPHIEMKFGYIYWRD